jgi:hypothetical protein
MTGAVPPGGRPSGTHGGGTQYSGTTYDARDLWPRDFGRDGVSGLVTLDRAMRGRDVSRPDLDDERVAAEVIDELLARVDGRRPSDRRGAPNQSSQTRPTPF